MYPRIFQIYGDIWVHSYGFMIVLGLFVFIYLCINHPSRKNLLSKEQFYDLIFFGTFVGIVGGRFLFILEDWGSFENNWLEVFYPWVGGLSSFGTIIFVLIFISIFIRLNKISLLPLLDLVAMHAPIVQAFGRIGCFLAGCCHGKIADTVFSVVYTNPECMAPLGVPLLPTQLIESFISFFIFIFLRFSLSKTYKSGQVLFSYLILVSLSRIMIDFLRGDWGYFISWFSFSQLVSFGIFLIGVAGLIYVNKYGKGQWYE